MIFNRRVARKPLKQDATRMATMDRIKQKQIALLGAGALRNTKQDDFTFTSRNEKSDGATSTLRYTKSE